MQCDIHNTEMVLHPTRTIGNESQEWNVYVCPDCDEDRHQAAQEHDKMCGLSRVYYSPAGKHTGSEVRWSYGNKLMVGLR